MVFSRRSRKHVHTSGSLGELRKAVETLVCRFVFDIAFLVLPNFHQCFYLKKILWAWDFYWRLSPIDIGVNNVIVVHSINLLFIQSSSTFSLCDRILKVWQTFHIQISSSCSLHDWNILFRSFICFCFNLTKQKWSVLFSFYTEKIFSYFFCFYKFSLPC